MFDKIHPPFMIKTLKKISIEGVYLNIIKTIYDKPRAYIILNREKLKAFSLRSGARQGCSLLPLVLVLEVQSSEIRKINKRHPIWKGRSKTVTICGWHDFIFRKP